MKVALGSDHGGFELKEFVKGLLIKRGIEVEDCGCHSRDSVDYPDYAREVASRVSRNAVEEGILVCTTGIGMSIAANKFPGVRAALCLSPYMARMARTHNNANVLALGGDLVAAEEAEAILNEWLKNSFQPVERHERRVAKLTAYSRRALEAAGVFEEDPETYTVIQHETEREQSTINLIASENYASRAVKEAQGSVMTNKYAGTTVVNRLTRLSGLQLKGQNSFLVRSTRMSSRTVAVPPTWLPIWPCWSRATQCWQ